MSLCNCGKCKCPVPETPRQTLSEMQDNLADMLHEIEGIDGNQPNVAALRVALVRVMNELDIAVQRAGRL